jgi:hypothetical protein
MEAGAEAPASIACGTALLWTMAPSTPEVPLRVGHTLRVMKAPP